MPQRLVSRVEESSSFDALHIETRVLHSQTRERQILDTGHRFSVQANGISSLSPVRISQCSWRRTALVPDATLDVECRKKYLDQIGAHYDKLHVIKMLQPTDFSAYEIQKVLRAVCIAKAILQQQRVCNVLIVEIAPGSRVYMWLGHG